MNATLRRAVWPLLGATVAALAVASVGGAPSERGRYLRPELYGKPRGQRVLRLPLPGKA